MDDLSLHHHAEDAEEDATRDDVRADLEHAFCDFIGPVTNPRNRRIIKGGEVFHRKNTNFRNWNARVDRSRRRAVNEFLRYLESLIDATVVYVCPRTF